jgi:hypothetical protein
MATKQDIEPVGAAKSLKGLAGKLTAVVNAHADAFIAQAKVGAEATAPGSPDADKAPDIDKVMRAVALIARAALALHQLQAAEDKADDRALDRAAERARAAVRALHPINPEEDETDMNEPDPRLADPALMAEADRELERRLDAFALDIKAQSLRRNPAGRPSPSRAGQLDDPKPPAPAPAP